jgi:glycosyltransferase involved in cell wall biosynthesis
VTTVGVNLLWCLPGQVGGSEQYLTRSLLDVVDHGPDLEPVLFVLPGFAAAHPELAGRHELVVAPISGRHRSIRVAAERTWLDRAVHRRRLALVHHGGGTAPPMGDVPMVLTVHDIQYLTYPEHFSRLKRAWLRHAVPAGLRQARVVTTPSEFVKSTLVTAYDADPDRVVVVPHGVPPDLASSGADEAVAEADLEVRARHGLAGGFLLYPAATYPHKNHRVLLDALRLLPASIDLKLVLIGSAGRGEAALRAAVGDLGLETRVVRAGRVPDSDRDSLLRQAEALVFPSRYEGFGAPVLEAFAIGTPVIAADATALPEVVGNAGLLIAPDDPAAWAAAIERVTTDATLRARFACAGRARAQELSTSRSAAALVGAYRQALAGKPSASAPSS